MAGEPVHFTVHLTDNSGAWFNHQVGKANAALKLMGQAIKNRAKIKVPKKDHDLEESARVESKNLEVKVVFGGGGIEYAGYQERGHRYDGSHQVRHYTTAGTGAHYLEESGEQVVEEGIKKWLRSAS